MNKNGKRQKSEGIVIGFNKIPVDQNIISQLKQFNYDLDYVSKCLEANRHNNVTTSYYLSLKKYVKEGGVTTYDISSK